MGQVRSGQVKSGQVRSSQAGGLDKALTLDLWSCFVYFCVSGLILDTSQVRHFSIIFLDYFCFSGGQLLRPLVLLLYEYHSRFIGYFILVLNLNWFRRAYQT